MSRRGILLLLDFVPDQRRTFETFLLRLARELLADGWFAVFVFSGEPDDAFSSQLRQCKAEYRVVSWPLTRRTAGDLAESVAAVPLLAMTNAFVSLYSPYILWLKKRLGIPYWIVHDESSGLASAKSGLKRALARLRGWYYGRHISRVLAVSEFVARRNVEQSFLPPTRVRVLRNAVDLDRFHPPEAPHAISADPRVVFVGQLITEKGIWTLLRAVLLLKQGPAKLLPTLEVAGRGPLEKELQIFAADHALERVKFLGQVSDVVPLYQTADIVVVPSEWAEAAAFVIAEAMACGACILASDAGGNPDLVGRDEEGGRLFRHGDATDLADHLAALLTDPAARQTYRTRARARAERLFGLDDMVRGFVRELRDVCRDG